MRKDLPLKPNAICAFIVCKDEQGAKVLLLKRQGGYLDGTWQQVVGGIEQGETAAAAALREIKEETGLTPDALYSADLVECFYHPRKDYIRLAPVFVAFVGEKSAGEGNRAAATEISLAGPGEISLTPFVELSDEHTEYKWVTFAEALPLLPFWQQRDCIRYIEREFIKSTPHELLRIEP